MLKPKRLAEVGRRQLLRMASEKLAISSAFVATLASTATFKSRQARAATLASQASAGYVGHPATNGDHCGACQFFVAGTDATAVGTCQAVAGAISPQGYCPYFSAKS